MYLANYPSQDSPTVFTDEPKIKGAGFERKGARLERPARLIHQHHNIGVAVGPKVERGLFGLDAKLLHQFAVFLIVGAYDGGEFLGRH